MRKPLNDNIPVYKCPLLECKAFYSNLNLLLYHLTNAYHNVDDLWQNIKCPINNCNYTDFDIKINRSLQIDGELTSNLEKHCFESHNDDLHVCLDIFHEIYDNEKLCVIKKIRRNFLPLFDKIGHSLYKTVNIQDLLSSNSEFGKLFNAMQTENCFIVKKKDQYKCQIFGCLKEYESRVSYNAHISTHKHSVSKLINFASKSLDLNFSKLSEEMIFFDFTFSIDKIPQILFYEKDLYIKILFKNDFKQTIQQPKSLIDVQKPCVNSSVENFKTFYESIEPMTVAGNAINCIWFKGLTFIDQQSNIYPNFTYLNLNECITCAILIQAQESMFFIGTKNDFNTDILSKFYTLDSKIYIVNTSYVIYDVINITFGFPRKMISFVNNETNTIVYILFSDGVIRKLEYFSKKYSFSSFNITNIVDFELIDINTVVCTDGKVLYKIEDGTITHKSEYFDSFINSLCIRTKICDRISVMENTQTTEDSDDFSDLKSKTQRNFIIFSTVNGKIYAVDENLENKLSLIKNFYSHRLIYVEKDDEILFTNQLYNTSKVLIIDDTYSKTRGVLESLFFSACRVKSGYFFGQNDGYLLYLKKKQKKSNSEIFFRFVKKRDVFFILDTFEEMDYVKISNYECLIREIIQDDLKIHLFFKCGIVFNFLSSKN